MPYKNYALCATWFPKSGVALRFPPQSMTSSKFGSGGGFFGFAEVQTSPFQSGRGLPQSKTWRIFGAARTKIEAINY